MESFAYVLILTLAIATLFFAIAFRDPPKSVSDLISQNPAEAGFFHAFHHPPSQAGLVRASGSQ